MTGVKIVGLLIATINSSLQAQIFIQAEDYTSMQGVQTEVTSEEGGGINVGWIGPSRCGSEKPRCNVHKLRSVLSTTHAANINTKDAVVR